MGAAESANSAQSGYQVNSIGPKPERLQRYGDSLGLATSSVVRSAALAVTSSFAS
ncbi:hypothetical protein R70199_08153 [Paraburkholderia domus]|nr:hypothetical protein R70199_08153 [Paraburkholderia domus]